MDSKLEAILHRTGPDTIGSHPLIFRLPTDQGKLDHLLDTTTGVEVHDRISAQLRELIKSLNPREQLSEGSLQEKVSDHLNGRNLTTYGAWVYYPWSKRLVHVLDEEEFTIVRTDRNRNKITREEQQVLSTKKIGVIGLSVGQSVSLTMALERSFGEIRLADFDTLDLSNLNRLRAGVHELGGNKALITARQIAEVDPYLKVTCFPEGLTKDNMDAFFCEGGNLDILVEECDSVDIKILARQKAKAMGIPVVMDMSDRGCLDVERFDLEPERPLMHGWIDHLDLEAAGRPMTAEEKVPYMLPISGVETLSPRMKASMIELGQTLSTWPQLASSVVLGGALAGDTVRRISLDQFQSSGRWFVDFEEIITDLKQEQSQLPPLIDQKSPRLPFDIPAIIELLTPPSSDALELDADAIEDLVRAGGLAPSAGNGQPWKFHWDVKRLFLFHDESRSASFWDPDHLIAHIALGACIENIVLEAHAMNMEVDTQTTPLPEYPELICSFEFHDSSYSRSEPHVADHLSGMIGLRCTNRKISDPVPISSEVVSKMTDAVATMPGCTVQIVDQPEQLYQLAGLCGSAERIRLLHPIGHAEFFEHELRWTPDKPEGSPDGLDVGTLELSPIGMAGLMIASDKRAIGLIDRWKGGKGLEEISGRAIRASSAVALLSISNDTPIGRLNGGRAMERLWMTANASGFAVHPISAPIFMTHMLDVEGNGLREEECSELQQIRQAFKRIWNSGSQHPLFMVRLSRSGAPTMRSLRRPVNELFVQHSSEVQTLHPN